ncbi:hypothetical protein CsSME_00009057 [Camellia sinensis var. sinensis]
MASSPLISNSHYHARPVSFPLDLIHSFPNSMIICVNLAQQCHEKLLNEALDGYLKLLDACATAKDIFSEPKEDVKEPLSFLRRKRDGCNFGGYLTSRKKMKKVIRKLFKDLKQKHDSRLA